MRNYLSSKWVRKTMSLKAKSTLFCRKLHQDGGRKGEKIILGMVTIVNKGKNKKAAISD